MAEDNKEQQDIPMWKQYVYMCARHWYMIVIGFLVVAVVYYATRSADLAQQLEFWGNNFNTLKNITSEKCPYALIEFGAL